MWHILCLKPLEDPFACLGIVSTADGTSGCNTAGGETLMEFRKKGIYIHSSAWFRNMQDSNEP
jgi:hypothetical protein